LALGLAVFALSSFVPTQRFGAMMFCLLTAALVGNLFMLPSVLASPLAYFFGRRLIKQAKAAKIGDYASPGASSEKGLDDDSAVPATEHHVLANGDDGNGQGPAPSQVRRDTSHRMRTNK
jgi:hypothetical protein